MVDPSPPAAPDDAVERTRSALTRMGAPERLAAALVAALGPDADTQLVADPWRLLALGSVTPRQADFCARALLGEAATPDDPRRVRALVVHLLRRASREGHTAVEYGRMAGALRGLGVRTVDAALQAAAEDERILLVEELPEEGDDDLDGDLPELPDPERFLALSPLGGAEGRLGAELVRLTASEPIMDSATATETVQAAAGQLGRSPAPETVAALVTAALRGVTVLLGGPATAGARAEALRYAAAIAAESRVGLALAAPSASGAAALNRALADDGPRARTVAALLADSSPLEAGLVVVAEATALDTEAFAALAAACPAEAHLLLLADPAQLPSAGPGQVVADLVASRVAAVAVLPDDPEPGPREALAARVGEGELPDGVDAPGHEVVLVPSASPGEAAHRALQLVTDSVPRTFGLDAAQIQIVTAAPGGEAGSSALNAACKARFNPGPGAVRGLDPGDRVLLAGRGPGYAPGDTGVLRGHGEQGAAVELDDGTAVTVAHPAHLRPGWAIPLAAALGGAWPAAVAVFTADSALSRPALRTALTRGERHVSVVNAAGPALAAAVRDVPAVPRRTRLVRLLREG
ncbi:AAA family ATPase [Thermobifida halotolerans]|uniref:AAA family ATPase n=1 Tax=Thermobifida halotolerans TaxID=483545 RepID=A0AA97M624_9ACTN|nr:AAA family ATPase [Thermobifida halotolerans]UOE21611.1 AAA family ATPase [Thermobifida halotolerans]